MSWGDQDNNKVEQPPVAPVPDQIAIASPPLDVQPIEPNQQQQFLQELEKLGIDVKASGVGEVVGQLATGDLTNRELPGRIQALEKELETMPLNELSAYTGGQGVPQSVVNALVQTRIAEEEAKKATKGIMSAVLGAGAISAGTTLGVAPALVTATTEMQPNKPTVQGVALDTPLFADNSVEAARAQALRQQQETTSEKAKKKEGGLSKLMEIVLALISGEGLKGLFSGEKVAVQPESENKPDTLNPPKVGGMSEQPAVAKNPVTPQLKLVASNISLPATQPTEVSQRQLFNNVAALPTPQVITNSPAIGAGAGGRGIG